MKSIIIPKEIKPNRDKRSGARSIAVPIKYADFSDGALVLVRLKDENWNGSDIESITINYK